jgi:replicative DNA helicase
MGKTAFCLNIATSTGLAGVGVAIFSLEMAKEQLVLRMLCSEARINHSKVRSGYLAEREFPVLVNAAGRLAETPIYIDDTPAISVLELRAKARRLVRDREKKLGLLIVDYLQLMRGMGAASNREQEISEISRSLKALAKELNVPVIAISQLNRRVEDRGDKRPMMSDLRESGAIEQDADVIAFIYRDEVYNPKSSPDEGIAEVILSKQRNGPVGTVSLAFIKEYTRFEDLSRREESDYQEVEEV